MFLLYLVTKTIFVANCVGQFFVMNYFLGTDYMYGYELVKSYVMQMGEAKFWEHTHTVKFPKVTMCDLTVRRLGNVQRYTVQCVLPVNIFTEKIYLFIYFWFILISFLNIVSLVLWVGELTLWCDRQCYVSSHLCRMERLHAGDKSLCKRFAKYLQPSLLGRYWRHFGIITDQNR